MSSEDASERIERLMRASAERLKLGGFRKFILRGNVVDLATGIVIGAAFTAVITALVTDFLTPLIGIPMSGANEFAKRYWTIGGSRFLYGDFVNKLVSLILGIAPIRRSSSSSPADSSSRFISSAVHQRTSSASSPARSRPPVTVPAKSCTR